MATGIEFYIKIRDLTQGFFNKVKQDNSKLQESMSRTGYSINELKTKVHSLSTARNKIINVTELRETNRQLSESGLNEEL